MASSPCGQPPPPMFYRHLSDLCHIIVWGLINRACLGNPGGPGPFVCHSGGLQLGSNTEWSNFVWTLYRRQPWRNLSIGELYQHVSRTAPPPPPPPPSAGRRPYTGHTRQRGAAAASAPLRHQTAACAPPVYTWLSPCPGTRALHTGVAFDLQIRVDVHSIGRIKSTLLSGRAFESSSQE